MGKVAIITGGSRGLGAATVKRLASDGYDVCVNHLSNERAAKEVVEEAKSFGGNAIAVQANVGSELEIRLWIKSWGCPLNFFGQ